MAGLISLSPMTGARTVYKWVDVQGGIHYGDLAPGRAAGVTPVQLEEDLEPAAPTAPLRFRDTPQRPKPRKGPAHGAQISAGERLAKRCARYRERLSYYRSKMRAGYKAHQYNALEEKRRHYRRQLHRECR